MPNQFLTLAPHLTQALSKCLKDTPTAPLVAAEGTLPFRPYA